MLGSPRRRGWRSCAEPLRRICTRPVWLEGSTQLWWRSWRQRSAPSRCGNGAGLSSCWGCTGAAARPTLCARFQRLRSTLGEGLGIEPSIRLRHLEQAILVQDSSLDWSPLPAAGAGPLTRHRPIKEATSDTSLSLSPFPLSRRLTQAADSRFVGRARELDRLLEAYDSVASGDGRALVLIAGEAGIGKTALAGAFARVVHSRSGVVIYGRCDEALITSYQPFVDALSHLIRYLPEDQWRHHARALAPMLPGVHADTVDPAPRPAPEPETQLLLMLASVVALLDSTEPLPMLLILDDLHWADRSTILMLQYVIRATDDHRLCIVGTYRDSELEAAHPLRTLLTDLHREPGVIRLHLDGLDQEEVVDLIRSSEESRSRRAIIARSGAEAGDGG